MASRKTYYVTVAPEGGVSDTPYNNYYLSSTLVQGSLFVPETGDIIARQDTSNNSVTYYGITAITYNLTDTIEGRPFTFSEVPVIWCAPFGVTSGGTVDIVVEQSAPHTLKIFK